MADVINELFKMQDIEYKKFHSALIPTVSPDKVIGIRTPKLRKFARYYLKNPESRLFLKELPHKYYEENNLHAFLIEQIYDYDVAIVETERFLPHIDNWATCDSFMPKVFSKNKDKILNKAYSWINSNDTYTIRFGIKMFMSLFLDDDFSKEQMEAISKIHSNDYYVKMMVSWYFATALVKQYDVAVVYLEKFKLDKWIHNKTIQKSIESNRIPNETKLYLKTLKIK